MFFTSFIPQHLSKFCFTSFLITPYTASRANFWFNAAVHTCKVAQTILGGTRLYQKNILYGMYKTVLCMYCGVAH